MSDLTKIWLESGFIPRRGQARISLQIAEYISEGKRVALSAPTGWGKTIVTLIALKSSGLLPALWLVRSLSIGDRVLTDAERIKLRSVVLAGKEKCCLKVLEGEIEQDDVYEYCRRARYKCEYYLNLKFKELVKVNTYLQLIDYLRPLKICPYYAQELLNGDIIVQNYYRRKRNVKCVVIDEAHNIVQPREISIRVDRLNDIIAELKKSPLVHTSSINEVERFYRWLRDLDEGIVDPLLFLSERTVREVGRAYIEYLDAGVKTKIGGLLRVLRSDVLYKEGDELIGFNATKISIPSPSVLLSGTLFPELLNILRPDEVIEVPYRRRKAVILDFLTTKYGEFEDASNLREFRELLRLLRRKFHRVVAFGSWRVVKLLKTEADFVEILPKDWSGILMLKARGRYSEGVDIPADVVVILGAPYLTPEVIRRLTDSYLRTGLTEDQARNLASEILMLLTTIQCIGRVTRDPSSNPLIVLADHRFKRQNALEKFFEIVEVKDLKHTETLIKKWN